MGDETSIQVRRAAEGDAASLGWIVERFSPVLIAQARHRLVGPLRRRCDPEDLVQDVWAVALPKLTDLDARDGRLTPVLVRYLATTLLHKVNNLLRRAIRSAEAELGGDSADSPSRRLLDRARGVVSEVAGREAGRLLLAAIDALPERDREVLVLRGIEGQDNSRVAEVIGDSPNAVSLRYNRVLKRLQREVPGSVFTDLRPDPEPDR